VLYTLPGWLELGAVRTAWFVLFVGGLLGALVTVSAMWALRLSELRPLWVRLRPSSRSRS